jgi:hypothetical protein
VFSLLLITIPLTGYVLEERLIWLTVLLQGGKTVSGDGFLSVKVPGMHRTPDGKKWREYKRSELHLQPIHS